MISLSLDCAQHQLCLLGCSEQVGTEPTSQVKSSFSPGREELESNQPSHHIQPKELSQRVLSLKFNFPFLLRSGPVYLSSCGTVGSLPFSTPTPVTPAALAHFPVPSPGCHPTSGFGYPLSPSRLKSHFFFPRGTLSGGLQSILSWRIPNILPSPRRYVR